MIAELYVEFVFWHLTSWIVIPITSNKGASNSSWSCISSLFIYLFLYILRITQGSQTIMNLNKVTSKITIPFLYICLPRLEKKKCFLHIFLSLQGLYLFVVCFQEISPWSLASTEYSNEVQACLQISWNLEINIWLFALSVTKEIDYVFTGKSLIFLRLMPTSLRLVDCQNSIFLKPDHVHILSES